MEHGRIYCRLFIVVAVVAVRHVIGGDKGAGSVLSVGSFEYDFDGNLEGVSPGEGDPTGVYKELKLVQDKLLIEKCWSSHC